MSALNPLARTALRAMALLIDSPLSDSLARVFEPALMPATAPATGTCWITVLVTTRAVAGGTPATGVGVGSTGTVTAPRVLSRVGQPGRAKAESPLNDV